VSSVYFIIHIVMFEQHKTDNKPFLNIINRQLFIDSQGLSHV